MREEEDIMKNRLHIIIALLPLACAPEEPFAGYGEGEGSSSEAETGSSEEASSSASESDDEASSDEEETGTAPETGDGDGDGDGGSGATGDGDGDGDGDEGDGDGDEPDLPEELDMGVEVPDPIFPGDDCDPFVDECLDNGGDFECQQDVRFDDQNQPEVYFRCAELNLDWGDGMYGASCSQDPYGQCTTGFWCRSEGQFPPNTCAGAACCIELCHFGQACGNQECVIDVWQVTLADYLDGYDGIGHCP